MDKQVIIENFWPPCLGDGDSCLYADELGWRDFHKADAHGGSTRHIFDFYVGHYAFDLILYYVEKDVFLYIDSINGNVFELPQREDWDGRFIFERCEFTNYPEPEPREYLFEFSEPEELWNDFCYDGHNLPYLIEHSVIDTQH